MSNIEGKAPVADWMQKYANPDGTCNCGCQCEPNPCYPICPGGEEDIDSDTLYQQMQYAVTELERIINGLDLPATTKYQIIHLATCNIRLCMKLLELIKKNAADIATLNEQLTQTNTNVQTNANDIAGIKGDISAINTQISNLETKHNNQQTQINENATAINELRAHKISRCEFEKVAHSVYEHHIAISNLETQVTNNKTAVDASISQLTTKVNSVETVANNAMAKVNEIAAVVTPEKIAALDEGIAENAKAIEALKSAYTNNREYIGKVDEKVQSLIPVVKNIHADVAEHAAKIASNAAGVEDNRKGLVALKAAVETLQATDNVHGTDIASLKVRVDKLDEAVVAAEAHINKVDTGLSAEVNAIMDKLKVMEPKLNDADAQLVALDERVKGLEAKVNGVEGDNESLSAKYNELSKAVDENKAAIKTLNETCATIHNDMVTGFNNINTNVANGFNTINGGIDNEIRPAINANTQAIARHTTQIGDLQNKDTELEQALQKEVTTREEKDAAQDAVLDTTVKWTSIADGENPNRKTIVLANHDSISGLDTNGTGHNLVMLSKWNKADFGDGSVPCNLNGTELTYNDDNNISHTPKD